MDFPKSSTNSHLLVYGPLARCQGTVNDRRPTEALASVGLLVILPVFRSDALPWKVEALKSASNRKEFAFD